MATDFAVSLEVRPQGYVRGTREVTTATKGLTDSTRESTKATKEETASRERLAQAERRQSQVTRELTQSYQRRMELMAQLHRQHVALQQVLQEEARRQAALRQQIEATNAAKRQAAASALNLRNAYFALSGALAALGLGRIVREGIQVALTFDRIHNALTAATGSQSLARQEMAFVTAEADRLGLVLTKTAQTYAGLANAARGTVLQGQAARDIFSAVSEAATVLGLTADQAQGALMGVQQTISKGRVTAEEMVQQISERLPGAYQAMATSLGISTAELGKRMEQGKVGLQDLVGWAEQLRKQFSAGLLTAINSDQANLNRLQNMIDSIKGSLGEGFLSGFLTGFEDLREDLSGEELKAAARDLGETIGEAMRTAADAATFLAQNLEFVKAAIMAILALKIAAWFIGLAAAIATATGATLTFKAAASNLALAGGLGAVAVALGIVVVAMDQYISRSRLAHETEMSRLARSQELTSYYNTLKSNKDGLTQAEWGYAEQVKKTMEAERAAMSVSLARTKAQLLASQTLNPFKYMANAGPGRNALAEQAKEQERELQTIDNQLNILQSQWDRLGKLPVIELPKIDSGDADKAAKKIQDLLETFRRAAEQAERVTAANRNGAAAAHLETQAIERENAAYQALNSLEGVSAATKARLSEIIQGLVGRTQAATEATQQLTAARERDLQFSDEARQAEARLMDARTQMTLQSRELAAQLEAEAIARSKNLDEMSNPEGYAREIEVQLQAIRVRRDYIAGIDLEIDALEKNHAHLIAVRQAEAALADAKGEGGEATRQLTIHLATEEEARKRGIQQGTVWYKLLESIIALRQGEIAALNQQKVAQEQLNEAQARQAQVTAEFQDWQQQTAAAEEYGDEVAGILAQYGLLSRATRELFILEESVARARAQNIDLGTAEGQERLRIIEAAVAAEVQYEEGLRRIQAEHELLAYTLEPMTEAWASVDQQVTGAIVQWVKTGEFSFKKLADSLLDTMIEAIIEMVKRWILAHRAMQAEAARTAAINAAAAKAGTATGGASGLSGAGAMVQGTPGTMGGGGGGGAGMASAAGMASVLGAFGAFVIVAMAMYSAFKSHAENRQARKYEMGAVVTMDNGQWNQGQMAEGSEALSNEIKKVVEAFVDSIGGLLTGFADLQLQIRRDGKYFKSFVEGELIGQFESMQEAVDAAIVAAFASPETRLAGISAEFRAVMESLVGNVGMTLEGLKEAMDTARAARAARIGELGSRVLAVFEDANREIRAAERLGLSINDLIEARDREARAIINSALGINMAVSERLRALRSLDAGMREAGTNTEALLRSLIEAAQQQIAQLLAEMARDAGRGGRGGSTGEGGSATGTGGGQGRAGAVEVSQWNEEIAALQAQIDRWLQELGRIPEGLSEMEIRMGIFDALFSHIADNQRLSMKYEAERVKYAKFKVEMEFAAIKAQLILWNRWEEFAAMFNDIYAAQMEAAGRRPGRVGRGGGSGRAEGREDAREQARRMGMDAITLAVDDARLRFTAYADSLKKLGFSAAENASLLAAADRQLVRELAAIKDEVLTRGRTFVAAGTPQGGPLLTGLADLKKTEQELIAANRALYHSGLLTIREMRDLNIQIRTASRRQAEAMVSSAASGLLMDLYNLLGDEKEAAQLRFDLTVAELEIRREELRIAMLTLNYTEQQMQAVLGPIGKLVDRVIEVGPSLFLGLGGGGGAAQDPELTDLQRRVSDWWASQHPEGGGAAVVDPSVEALRRLGEIEELRLSPLQREINAVNREFDGLRAVLGNTARVQAAYALAIQDIIQQHLDPVRGLLASLNTSQYSPLEQGEKLAAAQDAFLGTVAAIRGGNYADIDNLATLAQDYLAQAMAALPTGSEAYRGIFANVNTLLNSILAQFGGLGTDPGGAPGATPALNVTPVVDAVQQTGAETVIELRFIRNATEASSAKLGLIESRLERGLVVAGGVS